MSNYKTISKISSYYGVVVYYVFDNQMQTRTYLDQSTELNGKIYKWQKCTGGLHIYYPA